MLKKRIATAVILIAVLVGVILLLPPVATVVAVTLMVLAGAWEWSAFLRAPGTWIRILYVLVIAALLPITWNISGSSSGRTLLLSIALLWWIGALAWIIFAPHRATPWTAAFAGILALVPAWTALIRMRLDMTQGAEWILFALVLVWAADVGAYFAGRRFGRHKLAPNVSPGKTWEGALGGVLLSVFVAVGGSAWFSIPVLAFLPLCIIVVAFSIVGDLTESLLKRFAGVKDSGKLFPGHGGVMDRIDSVTAAAPLLFCGLIALGVAP